MPLLVDKYLPKVRLFSRQKEGVTPLKGYVTSGYGMRRIYFTAPILAPSTDLRKFAFWGKVKLHTKNPPPQTLQENVLRYYASATKVAMQEYQEGNFETISSKEFSKKVNSLYFQTLEQVEDSHNTTESHNARLKDKTPEEMWEQIRESERIFKLWKLQKKIQKALKEGEEFREFLNALGNL